MVTAPTELLSAIAKADEDVAVIIARDVLLTLGGGEAEVYKAAFLPVLRDFYSAALGPVRKRLGRSYVEGVSKGDDGFDPQSVAMYEHVLQGLELVSKIESDWYVLDGKRIQVFRNEKGQFTRKTGGAPTSRDAKVIAPFLAPVSGATRDSSRHLPLTYASNLKPVTGTGSHSARAEYATDPEEIRDKQVTHGLQAHYESRKLTQDLTAMGVLPPMLPNPGRSGNQAEYKQRKVDRAEAASKLNVTATFVGALEGKRHENVPLVFDVLRSSYVPEEDEFGIGYAIESMTVSPVDPDDEATADKLEERIVVFNHTFGTKEGQNDYRPSRSGHYVSTVLAPNDLDTNSLASSKNRLGAIGGGLRVLGLPGAAGKVDTASSIIGGLDSVEVRTAMTQTGYRFRGVEAPQVSNDLVAAAERLPMDPSKTGYGESRAKYYRATGSYDEQGMAIVPKEALIRGQQRDQVSLALWNRAKRRSSNAGMGSLTQSSANYNALAQKIAQGIGRGMPSEGVMIDSRGNITSQSAGIAHDYFVPFNVEALKTLDGGQYVRTRQLGGVTGEDLRTLLVGNGRSAQVVSSSGVYELELDPSVRGTRRYNDKTLQMIDTYDRILDEVASGGHYAVPLPPKMEKEAREMAARKASGSQAKYGEALRAARHDKYGEMAVLPEQEEARVMAEAKQQAAAEFTERFGTRTIRGERSGTMQGKVLPDNLKAKQAEYADARAAEAVSEAGEQRARMLQLNSEGYALALNTLQQYYPYLIRTARYRSWEQMNEEANAGTNFGTSGGTDKWRPEPGQLRPTFGNTMGAMGGGSPASGDTPSVADTRQASQDAARAKQGLPTLRSERAQYVGEYGRIRPGVRMSNPSGGTEASTGSGRAGTVMEQRLASYEEQTTSAIKQIDGLTKAVDAVGDGITQTKVDAAGGDSRARLFMLWYSQKPDIASNYLAAGTPDSEKTMHAMLSKTTAASLVRDLEPTMNGQPVHGEDMQKMMDAVLTGSLRMGMAGSQSVAPGASYDAIPAYQDGKLTLLDAGALNDQDFEKAIAEDDVASKALAFARGSNAPRAGNPTVHPVEWRTGINVVEESQKALSNIAASNPGLAEDIRMLPSNKERLREIGIRSGVRPEVISRSSAILDHFDSTVGAQYGMKADITDKQSMDTVKAWYALGSGIEAQRHVMKLSEGREAYDPKVPGPLSGRFGKSDQQQLSDRQQRIQGLVLEQWLEEGLL